MNTKRFVIGEAEHFLSLSYSRPVKWGEDGPKQALSQHARHNSLDTLSAQQPPLGRQKSPIGGAVHLLFSPNSRIVKWRGDVTRTSSSQEVIPNDPDPLSFSPMIDLNSVITDQQWSSNGPFSVRLHLACLVYISPRAVNREKGPFV